MNVSLCVLTFNRSEVLRELLESVRTLCLHKLIVVDNCSTDGTQEIIKNNYADLAYIRLDDNIGAAARNYGLKEAQSEIVITLDDDVIGLDDFCLKRLIEKFGKNPKLGALNFQVRDYFTGEICNWVHHKKEEEYADKDFPTYEITEGAVAFRKAALEKAGYYAEDFFISHEGPDLAYRIMDSGYDVEYCGEIKVLHKHECMGRRAWLNYYYDTRNLFLLAARNLPLSYALKYVTRGACAMLLYALRDGFFAYWFKGMKDGIAGIRRGIRHRKVLNPETLNKIKGINRGNPNFIYILNKRLLRKSARL